MARIDGVASMKLSAVLLAMSFLLVGCDSPMTARNITSIDCEWQLGSEFDLVEDTENRKTFTNSSLDNPGSVHFLGTPEALSSKLLTLIASESEGGFDIYTYKPTHSKFSIRFIEIRRGQESVLLTGYDVLSAKKMVKNCIERGSTPLLTYSPDV